jgi:hypothetical protein
VKPINTLSGQNVEFLNFKACDIRVYVTLYFEVALFIDAIFHIYQLSCLNAQQIIIVSMDPSKYVLPDELCTNPLTCMKLRITDNSYHTSVNITLLPAKVFSLRRHISAYVCHSQVQFLAAIILSCTQLKFSKQTDWIHRRTTIISLSLSLSLYIYIYIYIYIL